MLDIDGSILTIQKLIKKQGTAVQTKNDEEIFSLTQDRIYIIPNYQREIRWEKENIITLLDDVKTGEQFLGNVILSKIENSNDYYLIDGQQRITIINLTIYAIHSLIAEKKISINIINKDELCILNNSKYDNFIQNLEREFSEKESLGKDPYRQREKFEILYKAIKEYVQERLTSPNTISEVYQNLINSKINVVVSKNKDLKNITSFLDVNTKGISLDVEDIFKTNILSLDYSEKRIGQWIKLKEKSFELIDNDINLNLMDSLRYGFYVNLKFSEKKEYRNIKFNTKFKITESITINGKIFSKGDHLIKVLCDNNFIAETIDDVIDFHDFLIAGATLNNQAFAKNFFKQELVAKHNVSCGMVSSLIQGVIKEQNKVPKLLLYAYFIKDIKNTDLQTMERLKRFHSIFTVSTMFCLYEKDKETPQMEALITKYNEDKITEKIGDNNVEIDAINKELCNVFNSYLTPDSIYSPIEKKIIKLDGNKDEAYRAKSYALIYNFFEYDNVKKVFSISDYKKAYNFLTDKDKFSLEHFIFNESGKFEIKGGKKNNTYSSKDSKISTKSVFNFIFISQTLNDKLGHLNIMDKIKIAMENLDSIECDYSKMYLNTINELEQESTITDSSVNNFINNNFETFAGKIIENFKNKFK